MEVMFSKLSMMQEDNSINVRKMVILGETGNAVTTHDATLSLS